MDEIASAILRSPDPKTPSCHVLTSVSKPFIGVAGGLFLEMCLWCEIISSISRRRRTLDASFVGARWLQFPILKNGAYSSLGTVLCLMAAALLTCIFYETSFKTTLPFVFLAIIVFVTMMFGRQAGVLGTLGAALIFASVLFEPRPSLAIEDPIAQTHLIWMIVIGIVLAEVFGQPRPMDETAAVAAQVDDSSKVALSRANRD